MKVKNIDTKLEKEWKVTESLRVPLSKEHLDELKALTKGGKLSATLTAVLDEKNTALKAAQYIKFPYSKQIEDFANAHVRLTYDDGTIVEPLSKHYKEIARTNMKSASVISESNKVLFTLDIINDNFIYKRRNLVPPAQDQAKLKKIANPKYGHMWWTNPKRCFILGTEGRKVFVWDSGEATEISDWAKIAPYNKPFEGET